MTLFAVAMAIGLGGLLIMALPGMRGHGRSHVGGKLLGRAHVGGKLVGRSHSMLKHGATAATDSWIPEPRAALSMLALFGAFGDVARVALNGPLWVSCLIGLVPAVGIEAWVVGPLWRATLRFQGRPSSPLAGLVMEEARAVTGFRNGRGIVQVVRDGRAVQLSAQLVPAQVENTVRVGDRLRVEDVDVERERVLVAVNGSS